MKNDINKLFYNYQNNIFENKGKYPYATNLVFGFADYVEKLESDDLWDFFKNKDIDVAQLKSEVEEGTSAWLEDNAKTLAIYYS